MKMNRNNLTVCNIQFGKIFVIFSLLISSTFFVSCVDSDDKQVETECTVDEDCKTEGEICAPNSTCMETRIPLEVPMGLELYDQRPDSNTKGQLLFDIGPDELTISDDGKVHITKPDPVNVSGTVRTTGGIVNATIITYRLSNIPGKDVVTSMKDLGTINSAPGADYNFSFGQKGDYLFQVIPQPATDYAPLIKYVNVTEDKNIDLTLGDTNFTVSGFIRDDQGAGIDGATVWIFDFQSGASSTVGTTTSDSSGFFSVQFSDIPTTLSIFAGPGEYTKLLPSTRFDFSASQVAAGSVIDNGISHFDTGILSIPTLPESIAFSTTIYGTTTSGNTEFVAGAKVEFVGKVGGGTQNDGVVVAEGTTDASGSVKVDLIPGEFELGRVYEVTVTTPMDSPFASIKKEIEVGNNSGFGESIELENRITVVGQVIRPDETESPLSSVLVEAAIAYNAAQLNPEAMINPDYVQSSQTDADGWFTLLLDPGYYDISLMVPSNYWFPYTTFDDQLVSQNNKSGPLRLQPSKPALVQVVLNDSQGNPIPDIQIRAYKVSEECSSDEPCEIPARLLSTSTSYTNGEASILVPFE